MLFVHQLFLCLRVFILLWLCLTVSCDNDSNNSYFPPDVKICSAKDPNLDECFTTSANKMLKHLRSGIRNLNAVPMDPLHVPLLSLERGNRYLPSMAFNVSNTVHNGWKDAVMLHSKVNLKSHEFHFVLYFPHYVFRGLYQISGKIIGIPLDGSGDFEVRFTNSTSAVTVRGHLEERNGEDFFVIDNTILKSEYFGTYELELRNLFNNSALSAATNSLINRNIRAYLAASTPVMDDLARSLYVGLVQAIFDRVPYKAMFTDLQ